MVSIITILKFVHQWKMEKVQTTDGIWSFVFNCRLLEWSGSFTKELEVQNSCHVQIWDVRRVPWKWCEWSATTVLVLPWRNMTSITEHSYITGNVSVGVFCDLDWWEWVWLVMRRWGMGWMNEWTWTTDTIFHLFEKEHLCLFTTHLTLFFQLRVCFKCLIFKFLEQKENREIIEILLIWIYLYLIFHLVGECCDNLIGLTLVWCMHAWKNLIEIIMILLL